MVYVSNFILSRKYIVGTRSSTVLIFQWLCVYHVCFPIWLSHGIQLSRELGRQCLVNTSLTHHNYILSEIEQCLIKGDCGWGQLDDLTSWEEYVGCDWVSWHFSYGDVAVVPLLWCRYIFQPGRSLSLQNRFGYSDRCQNGYSLLVGVKTNMLALLVYVSRGFWCDHCVGAWIWYSWCTC